MTRNRNVRKIFLLIFNKIKNGGLKKELPECMRIVKTCNTSVRT